jgi:hypothetical protein
MGPPITVIFVCSKCGAGYQAIQRPFSGQPVADFAVKFVGPKFTHGAAHIPTMIGRLSKRHPGLAESRQRTLSSTSGLRSETAACINCELGRLFMMSGTSSPIQADEFAQMTWVHTQ